MIDAYHIHNKPTATLLNMHGLAMADPQSRAFPDIATKVTPSAFLIQTLKESASYEEAFDNLTGMINDSSFKAPEDPLNPKTPEQKNFEKKHDNAEKALAQQARTLLVRAHPELIPGLANNLAYLPNRFVSYFKQQLPRLTNDASRQRFTQSIVMETLKSMPELPQEGQTRIQPGRIIRHSVTTTQHESGYDQKIEIVRALPYERNLTPQENQQEFNNDFYDQLDEITTKYAKNLKDLTKSTSTEMFLQWSRNIITDIALLVPRTAGAIVGGAIGGTAGLIVGAGKGFSDSVRQSADATGTFFNEGTSDTNDSRYNFGSALGGSAAAVTVAPLNAAKEAIGYSLNGTTNAANACSNAFENTGKYIYNSLTGSSSDSAQ